MEECCDICGDVGVKEAIIICCKCKSNSEHMYCMKIPLEEPIDWTCEECKSIPKVSLQPSSVTGPLPCMSKLPSRLDVHVKSEERETSVNQWRKKASFDWEKKVTTGKTKYISAEEAILLSFGANKSMPTLKRPPHSSRPYGKFRSQGYSNLEMCKEEHLKKGPGGNGYNTMELAKPNIKNVNRNLLPDFETHAYTPALGASWQGSFSIRDHKNGTLNLRVHGHSPSKVCKKVYEFSKKMPEVIHFELVSCKKFWVYLFREYLPDIRDIGIYFFTRDAERSNYFVSFLESMNVENLALRKQIDEIELLVFTSKLLPVGCQCWQGQYFLWGVFHRRKREPLPGPDNQIFKLSGQAVDGANRGGDNNEVVDMDIDMLGGSIIGKVDVPVRNLLKS